MGNSDKLSLKKRIIFTFILCFIFIGLLELLLRVIFPIPEVINFNRTNYSIILNPENSNRFLLNAAFTYGSEPDGVEFVHNLNLYGFRDNNWNVRHRRGYQRVMFIGDSIVEGALANDEETISNGFVQAALKKNNLFEALNFGVAGTGLFEHFKLIRDAVPLFRPEYLFLVINSDNFMYIHEFDSRWLSSSFVPEYANFKLPRLYYLIDSIRYGKVVPRIWHSSPFKFLSSVPDSRNPWSSEINASAYEKFVNPKIADCMKRGTFNPYVVNWYQLNKKLLCKPFNILPHLEALKTFLETYSCKLYVVYIPENHQVSDAYLHFNSEYDSDKNPTSLQGEEFQIHAKILENICNHLNLPFWDLTQILREHEKNGERLWWNYDSHLKGKSYLLIGEYLYKLYDGELRENSKN